jgi:uncharacterized paraquat-inducible protein A
METKLSSLEIASSATLQQEQNPPTTAMEKSVQTLQDGIWVGLLGQCCLECEATDHQDDALYCLSCGSKL